LPHVPVFAPARARFTGLNTAGDGWHRFCNLDGVRRESCAAMSCTEELTTMHTLPKLPYSHDALEPSISRETLDYHHGKHHATYVKKLNDLIKGTELESLPLEELVRVSARERQRLGAVFNNAAQAWNHGFYWHCLTPDKTVPAGDLINALNERFGSVEGFQKAFSQSALANFGSGWTWLVSNADGELEIVNTGNADTPLTTGQIPLLTCDVWEHAYYIDYRNARADYLQGFWRLVNWDFVAAGFSRRQRPQDAA
jgi:Fe-Mn family superoxide dismutase